MKSRLIAGDREGALADADWALEAGATESESPIGCYAAALACLVRGEDGKAAELANTLEGRDEFPATVAETLVALAAGDARRYGEAIRALLADFESRHEYLEDIAVADTVLALQVLGGSRGLAIPLASPLLPE